MNGYPLTRGGPDRSAVVALLLAAWGLLNAPAGAAPAKTPWRAGPVSIDVVAAQEGWVGKAINAARWKPVTQRDLARRLERAATLRLVNVAPPPERCWVGQQPYLVPNRDGNSWDMVFPYFNQYRREQEVVIHDFGTGKTSRQVLSGGKGKSVLTREPIGFHMRPSFYTAGKLVFEMYGPVLFVVYDPAVDRFVHGSKPFGNDVVHGGCTLAADGRVHGLGWSKDKSGFVAYRFDPKTRVAKRSKPFGPANPNRTELYHDVRMSGDWLYAAIGNRPWHVVAFNVRTGRGRLLATTRQIRGSYSTISMTRMVGGFSATIREAASIPDLDTFDRKKADVWLHDGKVLRRSGKVPPWSDQPAKRHVGKRFRWAREFQAWPDDFTPPSPPPEINGKAGAPDPNGHVELPYRTGPGQAWKTLDYDVKMYPGEVRRLMEVNDHVLFATDSGYGQHVFYDVRARRLLRVGGTLSPYSMGLVGGRLYVSGYPSSLMYAYDFSRTIGLKQRDPNPRRVGALASKNDTHCPLAGTVGGADGRVYSAGTTFGRRRVGGGVAWYDPNTGEIGGMPIDGHRFFWMTSADNGRYILLSSKLGNGGELFCWDTRGGKMIYRKVLLGGDRPGPIVEALPGGLMIGHHGKGVLYGLRAATGDVLWTKPVPAPPVTSFSSVRRHAWSFRRGPNGHIWSFFGSTLVRIDPRDARVSAVGKLPDGVEPAELAFAEGKVYIAGGPRLQCIRGLSTPRPERAAGRR